MADRKALVLISGRTRELATGDALDVPALKVNGATLAAFPPVSSTMTSAGTLVVNTVRDLDSSGGAFTATMPASPATGSWLVLTDTGRATSTFNITLGRNSQLIMGLAEDMLFNVSGHTAFFQFVGGSIGWQLR